MADFRHMARENLKRAKNELASGDPPRLRYATLEIRYAMEALTYDRAMAYKADIPLSEYDTWPPKDVLNLLTEIDPAAALTSTISFGREETYGVVPDEMTVIGTDVVLTLANLKKQYGALGSYLHTPTLAKVDDPSAHDPAKLRKRIEASIKILDEVLASPVWNFTMGQFSEMPCQRCGKLVRKRLHKDGKRVTAICQCKAEYSVETQGDKVAWTAYRQEHPCPTEGCAATFTLWKDEVTIGRQWACESCGKSYHLGLQVFADDPSS